MDELLKQAAKRDNEDFTLTEEESQQLKRAFDDPEFRRMFGEYMQDMQSPQFREESEAYLRELEAQQQIPEGKKLIRPTPKFVVKARRVVRGNREKIFVNIVEHESIAAPKAERKGEGQQWSVPYSLGPVRMEKDKSDANVPTYDCCFHPEALQYAQRSKAFRDLLVKVALDGVKEAARRHEQEVELEPEYHILKGVTYKSGQVVSMMLGAEEQPARKADSGAAPASAEAKAAPKKTATAKEAPKAKPGQRAQLQPVSTTQKASTPAATTAAPSSDKTPQYKIVERGKVDVAGHMEGPAAPELRSTRPSELVVVFELPKVDRAAGLDLDVAERMVKLTFKDVYDVSVPLPYPVFGDRGAAKFDKAKRTLTLTIPVQPAPAVESLQRHDAQPEGQAGEAAEETEGEAGAETQREQATAAAGAAARAAAVDHSRWVQKPEQPEAADPAIQAAKAAAAAHPTLPKPQPVSQPAAAAAQELEIRRPPFEFRQNQRTVAVLIQVPGIKEDTVNVKYAGRKVYLSFLAEQATGGEAARQLSAYWQCLQLAGDVNEQECKVDVADRNMLLALVKAKPGFWGITPDTMLPPASTAAAPTGGVVDEADEQPPDEAKARLREQLAGASSEHATTTSSPEQQPMAAATAATAAAAPTKKAAKPQQAAAPTKPAPAKQPPAAAVAPSTPNLQLKTDLLFELD